MPLPRLRALVAVVLVLAACTGGSGPGATSTTTTGPGTGVTTTQGGDPETPATVAPPISDLVLDWTRIDDPTFDGGLLNAAVAAGPGLVAVGTDELDEDAAVWVSDDGTTWERVASGAFSGEADANGLEGNQFMLDVATGPAGIVAVGGYERRSERDLDPGVWLSPDGLVWERIADDDFARSGDGHLNAVIDWNGTFVAVGEDPGPVGSGEARPAVWTSIDGRDWVAADSAALRVDGVITAITRRGSRLVAVGSSGHVRRPTVWFSDDGASWDVITPGGDALVGAIDVGDVGDEEDMWFGSVAATPDGFVAAGGIGFPSRGAFWESPDGLFWSLVATPADVDRPTMPVAVESVITTSDGLVAVGTGRLDTTRFPPLSYAEVWVSLDTGASWGQLPRTSTSTAVEGPDSPWHIGGMHDVIRFGDGLLAVGFVPYQDVTLPGPFHHQAVWLGEWVEG